MRKSRSASTTKKSKQKGTVRKNVEVFIGTDNDFESFKQSVLADVGDISFAPRLIRLIKLYSDKDDDETSFWNHTAKVILTGIGALSIMFGVGVLIPFGYVLKVISGGSNTKLWLQQNPQFAKKLEKDKTFRSDVATWVVDTINTITITTDTKKGGVGKVVENVVKQE